MLVWDVIIIIFINLFRSIRHVYGTICRRCTHFPAYPLLDKKEYTWRMTLQALKWTRELDKPAKEGRICCVSVLVCDIRVEEQHHGSFGSMHPKLWKEKMISFKSNINKYWWYNKYCISQKDRLRTNKQEKILYLVDGTRNETRDVFHPFQWYLKCRGEWRRCLHCGERALSNIIGHWETKYCSRLVDNERDITLNILDQWNISW